jgi:NAD(P)-dependent dehydrogenase (short-subunit alcohol dehydrogenase family)
VNASPDQQPRVALVTGAGAGLGAEVARLFAESGHTVIVSDLDPDSGQALTQELRDSGARAHFVRCDVADEAQIAALVTETVRQAGRLDFAVNNAGIAPDRQPLLDLDVAAFDRVIAVNLRSIALCMKHQARQFVAQGELAGSIVNIGSTSSVRPQPNQAGYVAAKHGVLGLTKAGAIELAQHGIRVNAVLPGGMDTPMIRQARAGRDLSADAGESRLSLFGRLAHPREVAEAVVWLSSDKASYITGASLAADSGYLAR